jgi:hypothetical protein
LIKKRWDFSEYKLNKATKISNIKKAQTLYQKEFELSIGEQGII